MGHAADVSRGRCFEVGQADLSATRMVEARLGPPDEGEVLFAVEKFAFSANNVTYALLGEALRYWDLFPAEPGWGRIPVWGYLRVLASGVPGVEPGRRAYGLCPMATHVTLRPDRVGRSTFSEGSPSRKGLSSVYNVYSWAEPAPHEDAFLVLSPSFWLSFTLDDYLARNPNPDQTVVVTSASSKVAIGLAYLLTRRGVPVTGLTSPSRVAFIRSLSLYGQVLPYDQAESLPPAVATIVDLTGDATLRDRIDRHLARSPGIVIAGGTHGEAAALAIDSPDQRTVVFSAPLAIAALAHEQGWALLDQRFRAALGSFATHADSWLAIRRHRGLEDAAAVYQRVLTNAGSPDEAYLIDI
jgi:NADPH:quinone reductase-like Zn-dependent oxidoreductase